MRTEKLVPALAYSTGPVEALPPHGPVSSAQSGDPGLLTPCMLPRCSGLKVQTCPKATETKNNVKTVIKQE